MLATGATAIATIGSCAQVQSNRRTQVIESSIATASTLGEVLNIADNVTNYGGRDDFPEETRIYADLLQRSGAGDGVVDVLAARLTFAIGPNADGIPAECTDVLCAHTAHSPEFADIVANYEDWWGHSSSSTSPKSLEEIDPESIGHGVLFHLLEMGCGIGRDVSAHPYPPARRMQAIVLLAGWTGDHDLLAGKETVAEVLTDFELRRSELEERYRYLRFDPVSRRYILDEAAYAAKTPLSPVEQTIYGSPAVLAQAGTVTTTSRKQ
jgi:hypothetical protein